MRERRRQPHKRSRLLARGISIWPGARANRKRALKAAGVQSFIYEGCDALATLRSVYDILGVEIG